VQVTSQSNKVTADDINKALIGGEVIACRRAAAENPASVDITAAAWRFCGAHGARTYGRSMAFQAVLPPWRETIEGCHTDNAIAKEIVDAAFRIHTTLGPGLPGIRLSQTALAYELPPGSPHGELSS